MCERNAIPALDERDNADMSGVYVDLTMDDDNQRSYPPPPAVSQGVFAEVQSALVQVKTELQALEEEKQRVWAATDELIMDQHTEPVLRERGDLLTVAADITDARLHGVVGERSRNRREGVLLREALDDARTQHALGKGLGQGLRYY